MSGQDKSNEISAEFVYELADSKLKGEGLKFFESNKVGFMVFINAALDHASKRGDLKTGTTQQLFLRSALDTIAETAYSQIVPKFKPSSAFAAVKRLGNTPEEIALEAHYSLLKDLKKSDPTSLEALLGKTKVAGKEIGEALALKDPDKRFEIINGLCQMNGNLKPAFSDPKTGKDAFVEFMLEHVELKRAKKFDARI